MKNILLAVMFVFGASSLRAEPAYDLRGYLCQTMLIRLPAAAAQPLSDSPTDPWPIALAQIASGQAALLSASSAMCTNGNKVSCEGKVAKFVVEFLVAQKPGNGEIQIDFKSTDLTFKSTDYIPLEIGRSRILSGVEAPNDPTKRNLLLFRVMLPHSQ